MYRKPQICRTCLGAENTTFSSLDAAISDSDSVSIKEKISFCMPEFVLDIIPHAVICSICLAALHTTFSFKRKCLVTEKVIQDYFRCTKLECNIVELTQVVNFKNMNSDTKVLNEEQTDYKVEKEIAGNIPSIKVEPVDVGNEIQLENHDQNRTVLENTSLIHSINFDDNNKLYRCTVCSKSYKREIGLNVHLKIHKMKQTVNLTSRNNCLQSDATSEVKQFLPKTCDNIDAMCEICQKSFYSKSNLTVHMRIHTGEKPYKCNTCKKAFTQKVYLIAHERTHTGEKPFKCSLCCKSFAQKSYLRTHMIVHTGVRHHICKVCGKGCAHTGDLNNHMRIHTGEKPYKCSHCSRRFTQSVHLKSHIKIHSDEKPFQCQVCSARYTESRYLRKHMRSHTGERPFSCQICDKSFYERYVLNEHLKSHTGQKPFSCTVCNKTYSKSSHLTEHLRKHTGEKPFSCSHCAMNFAYKQSLNAHMKVHLKGHVGIKVENPLLVIKNESVANSDEDENESSASDSCQNDFGNRFGSPAE